MDLLDADDVKDMRREQFTRECRGKRMLRPQTRDSKNSRSYRSFASSGQQRKIDRNRRRAFRTRLHADCSVERVAKTTGVLPVLEKCTRYF